MAKTTKKLTDTVKQQIVDLFTEDKSLAEISRTTGVSKYKVKQYLSSLADEPKEQAEPASDTDDEVEEYTDELGRKRPPAPTSSVDGVAVSTQQTSEKVDDINKKVSSNNTAESAGIYTIYAE